MLSETAVNLLLQIPLAGVVVLVVILFLRHLKEITSAFMASQTTQSIATATTQKEQTALFMGAIKEQREENIKSLSEMTEGFKTLGDLISSRLDSMAVAKAVSKSKAR
jgi:hypothetical protein